MGIFEDVVINAKSALNVVGKKAGEIVDVSKLKINAVELQNKISKEYENLGKCVYEAYKKNKDLTQCTPKHIKIIDSIKKELDEANEKIASMKKKVRCKKCGFVNLEDAVYCCKCGDKFEKDHDEEELSETDETYESDDNNENEGYEEPLSEGSESAENENQ